MTDETTTTEDPFAEKPRTGIDRRTFVKVAAATAAAGAVVATGAGLVVPLSTAGGLKIKRFPYIGAKKVGGPAPQGLPLIPLKVNDAGQVEGIPQVELKQPADEELWKGLPVDRVGPPPEEDEPDTRDKVINFLQWYRYCGHDESPAFELAFTDDNVLRYFSNPVKVKKAQDELGAPLWYANKLGQPVLASDFREVGQGAPFRWRSESLTGNDLVTGIIIKIDPAKMQGRDVAPFLAPSNPANPDAKDLLAVCSYCAHFCCVPGYKESKIPREANLFDKIYCTCHDSVYDPVVMKQYLWPPNM